MIVRDALRANPDLAREYGELEKRLAQRFPNNIDAYIAGKTDVLCRILSDVGMPADEISIIRSVNAPA